MSGETIFPRRLFSPIGVMHRQQAEACVVRALVPEGWLTWEKKNTLWHTDQTIYSDRLTLVLGALKQDYLGAESRLFLVFVIGDLLKKEIILYFDIILNIYLRWYLMPLRGNERLLTARFSVLCCRPWFGSSVVIIWLSLFLLLLLLLSSERFSERSSPHDWEAAELATWVVRHRKKIWSRLDLMAAPSSPGPRIFWKPGPRIFGDWKISPFPLLPSGQSLTGSSEPLVSWSRLWRGWWRCPGGSGCPAASKSHASFERCCCCCSPLRPQCSPASEPLRCKN